MNSPSRRSFLQGASLAAASMIVPWAWGRSSPTPIGVQLYTVRRQALTDLPGTLAALRGIGFEMTESFSGLHTRPAKELRAMVGDAGLALRSAHFEYDTLEAQVEYAHELGVSFMVCAMLPQSMWNRDGFTRAAVEFNKAGALARQAGIRFCFHNHDFEFRPLPPAGSGAPVSGDMGLKILLENTNPQLVHWEEDCYWVTESGNDALALLEKHQDRVVMLHIKDRQPDAKVAYTMDKSAQFFTEVGTGTIHWEPIVKLAQRTGKLMFIEQDETAIPVMDSLKLSYQNLRKYLG